MARRKEGGVQHTKIDDPMLALHIFDKNAHLRLGLIGSITLEKNIVGTPHLSKMKLLICWITSVNE